jgi:outer membrane protein insertion porin family
LYEIGAIRFDGAGSISIETLDGVINSKSTSRSFPYSLFEFAYNNTKDNPLFPVFAKRNLEKNLKALENDIHFFSEDIIITDLENLRQFYSQNSYHEVQVSYTFIPDYKENINILTFIINQGPKYRLADFEILGLDVLPDKILRQCHSRVICKPGDRFSENKLYNDINQILFVLKNNGYYYSRYQRQGVVINNETKEDSVSVEFITGPRFRIGSIQFVDSLNGQKAISSELSKKQLEFSSGDWYSVASISKTESNLISLNMFEYVKIDTIAVDSKDSLIDLQIMLKYKKQQDYGFSALLNRTVVDKNLNAGVELSYSHKNIGGLAQNFNPFARFVMLDVSRAIYNIADAEYEYQIGVNLSQPLLWSIDQARIGISSQIMYSRRTINEDLVLSAFSFPIKFPVNLPRWTYFNSGALEVSFERQAPENFDDALSKAYKTASNSSDSIDILSRFYQFSELDKFVKKNKPLLTSFLIGATIVGDNRNHPIFPTKGYYTSLSIDGAPIPVNTITGVANFARFQALYSSYHSITNQSTLALKFRFGHIFQFNANESYVPYERQFFAGGANSIRGWASRRLRYYGVSLKNSQIDKYFEFAQDFIGNSTIIEGSVEWRFRVVPPDTRRKLATYFKEVSLAAFLDFGNAYDWYMFKSLNLPAPTISDYLKGIALAGGVGLRYDTPVGALRADLGWKLFDPNSRIDPELFAATSKLNQFQFHIGLGYPF